MFFIGSRHAVFSAEFKKLNGTSFVLSMGIVGPELGYILAYRAGWDVSRAPLAANTCLAIALVFIGFFAFGEIITPKQIFRMIICMAGLAVVTV